MAQVKFPNEVRYKRVLHPAHTPFEVADSDVECLVAKGAIVTIPPQAVESNDEVKAVNFDAMKVSELKAYAEEHGIDISKVEKKSDIIAAIKAAENSEENE